MYLRFISPLRDSAREVHQGLFQAIIQCRELEDYPIWLREQIEQEFDWFKKYLPTPHEDYFPNIHVRARADHICWFLSDAKEMIQRAYGIKALLNEIGCPITVRKTDNPGHILYRDQWQIVARPAKKTPILWC